MKYYILPTPTKIKEGQGSFFLNSETAVVLSKECGDRAYEYAVMLKEDILDKTGLVLHVEKGQTRKNAILLKLEIAGDVSANELEEKIKNESYKLEITEDGVIITAADEAGILYGVQTVRQLLAQCGAVLPCISVEDVPVLANRGFFHDATRGRVRKLDSYKRLADKAAYYKLNQLQLYVEHTFMFRDLTEVWRDDTPLTAEDILELDKYCAGLNIELIPSLATIGHLYKVLRTKSFCDICELDNSYGETFSFVQRMQHHSLNVTDERAWEFVKKLLDEYMPLFSSKHFNFNGDETFDLGKGRSKSVADEVGTHRIYIDFVKKICNYLIENGRTPMMWGDIIVGCPELIAELPKEVIFLTWGYAENEHFHNTEVVYNAGGTQYLCPGVHGWLRLINRIKPAYDNISRMCSYAEKYNGIGLLNTDWGDYGHAQDPWFSVTGMIYGAEGAWNGKLPEFEEINRRVSLVEYGDREEEFVSLIAKLGDQEGFSWAHACQYMEWTFDRNDISVEDKKAFYGRTHTTEPGRKNARIDECLRELAASTARINKNGLNVIHSYMVHAKGQQLLTCAGVTIGVKCLGLTGEDFMETDEETNSIVMNPDELAGELERWFNSYKENWRRDSKESELYRIQNMIFMYSDTLRQM